MAVNSGKGSDSRTIPLTNFATLGAGEMIARLVAFVVTAMLTRRLGAAGFGELAFAFAITSYLVIVPNTALQDLAIRVVSRNPDSAPRVAASVTRVFVLIGVGGIVAVGLLALFLPSPPSSRMLIFLCGMAVLPQAINLSWAYKALERTRLVSLSLTLAQSASLVGVLLFVHQTDDLLKVPIVQAVGGGIAAALLLRLVRGAWGVGSFSEGKTLLDGARVVILNRLLRSMIVTADIVMLGFMARSDQVGLYSAAYRVCFLLTAIAVSAHVVYHPALMRAHAEPAHASSVLTDATRLAWIVGLPLIAGGVIVAPDLLALLFGEPYREARIAFQILLISNGLLFLHGALSGAFLARHRLELQTKLLVAAAALNLLLNWILIAPMGIVGAAFATAAAEGLLLLGTAAILWRWHWRPDVRVLGRPAVAAAGMSIMLIVMPTMWHVAIRIAGGGVAYLALLALVGALPRQLWVALTTVFSRR